MTVKLEDKISILHRELCPTLAIEEAEVAKRKAVVRWHVSEQRTQRRPHTRGVK